MRVLMVHDNPVTSGYGAEAYVRRLVAGLRNGGDEVEVFAGEVSHRGSARVLDVWDPRARRLLRERVEKFRPDVIHHHNVVRELSVSVLGASDRPAVMTVHDQRLLGAVEHPRRSVMGVAERTVSALARHRVARRTRAVVGVSAAVTTALRDAGFPCCYTVPVPVLNPVVPPRPVADCRDVAVVARLAPDKGVDVVLRAFIAVADRIPHTVLHVAGDGPMRAALVRTAAGLGSQVVFHGHLDEAGVSALLGRVAVVVVASVPSRRPEGSSMALVEAAAHGRPVVASDDPAVRELADELAGVVVTPAGDVERLAVAIAELLADLPRAQRLGDANRETALRRHSIGAVAGATRRIYDEVLAA